MQGRDEPQRFWGENLLGAGDCFIAHDPQDRHDTPLTFRWLLR